MIEKLGTVIARLLASDVEIKNSINGVAELYFLPINEITDHNYDVIALFFENEHSEFNKSWEDECSELNAYLESPLIIASGKTEALMRLASKFKLTDKELKDWSEEMGRSNDVFMLDAVTQVMYLLGNTKADFYEAALAYSKIIPNNRRISQENLVKDTKNRNLIYKGIFPRKESFLIFYTAIYDAEDVVNSYESAQVFEYITSPKKHQVSREIFPEYAQEFDEMISTYPSAAGLIAESKAKRDYAFKRADEIYGQ